MQSRHGGDVLRTWSGRPTVSAPDAPTRRGDWSSAVIGRSQRPAVLLGQAVDVEYLGACQFVHVADPTVGFAQQRGHHATDVVCGDRRRAAGSEGQQAARPRSRTLCFDREVNNGLSRNVVGLTWITGSPDQFNTCSASQCRRCCLDSLVLVSVICETVIWDMLTSTSRWPRRAPPRRPLRWPADNPATRSC